MQCGAVCFVIQCATNVFLPGFIPFFFLSRAEKPRKLTSGPNVNGFITQLVEDRTGNAKVMSPNSR